MGQSLNLVNGLPFVQPKAKIGGIFCCFSFSSAYIYSTPLDELLILTEITAKQKKKESKAVVVLQQQSKKTKYQWLVHLTQHPRMDQDKRSEPNPKTAVALVT